MSDMEMRHREELETLKQEKGSLQALVGSQSGVIRELEAQLSRATGNSTALQRQQQEMMDTVHNLLNLCSKDGGRLTRRGVLEPRQQMVSVDMSFFTFVSSGKEPIGVISKKGGPTSLKAERGLTLSKMSNE